MLQIKDAILCALLAAFCCCDRVDDLIARINSAQSSWKADRGAGVHTSWRNLFFGLGGGIFSKRKEAGTDNIEEASPSPLRVDLLLPEEFDARKEWPLCTSIPVVWNQAACSSCWAISVANMISDRICVRSGGEVKVNLSAEHLVSCCEDCGLLDGCQGGDPRSALWYFYNNGLVTGGEYGSDEGCQPYSLHPCSIFPEQESEPSLPPCPNSFQNSTPVCHRTGCTNKAYNKNFTDDIYKAEWPPYQLDGNDDEIRNEIIKNGPVVAIFLAREDFLYYKTGVYKAVEFEEGASDEQPPAAWHSARVVGFGRDGDEPYWVAVNSWGRHWGEDGTFRILRGPGNGCNFESNMVAVIPSCYTSSSQVPLNI